VLLLINSSLLTIHLIIMNVLLVGDSHMGRGLDEVLSNLSSSISTFTVLLPRNIGLITLEYRSKLQDIYYFDPDVIIVHLGHNDLVRHPVHNLHPSVSTAVASSTITFADEIHHNFPNASIFISAILPRTYTDSSLLSGPEIVSYNKMAKRHGQRIRTFAKIAGYNYLINKSMWHKISNSIEDHTLFLPDGLHLNPSGQLTILFEWLETIATSDSP
jgi:lysophospholipase L1-like esterase